MKRTTMGEGIERVELLSVVKNPDKYLKKMALSFPRGSDVRLVIDAVKGFTDEEKSAWILSQPEGCKLKTGRNAAALATAVAVGCFAVVYYVTLLVTQTIAGEKVVKKVTEKRTKILCPQGGSTNPDKEDNDNPDHDKDDNRSVKAGKRV